MTGDPLVRVLEPDEVEELVRWAQIEGWNPSPGDAAAFRLADPNGFLGCFVAGEMVAGISAVAYDDAFGFIGLYIVRPDRRGQGYGMQVWKAGMGRLGARTIGLDGVPAQQANYERAEFRKAYETTRWSGCLSDAIETQHKAVAMQESDLAKILSIDSACFPARRAAFLRTWVSSPRQCFVMRRDRQLTGFSVIRRCMSGFKIGPIFAEDEGTAWALLQESASYAEGASVHLDLPDSQSGLQTLLQAHGFQPGFQTARMYRGNAPDIDMRKIFAITTLELG